jgi:hypothetical protein
MPSFCVIKQYYDGNYRGMAVSNTRVIYCGISALETTGIFITFGVNYHSIWTLEKVGFYTMAIYNGIFIKLATVARSNGLTQTLSLIMMRQVLYHCAIAATWVQGN